MTWLMTYLLLAFIRRSFNMDHPLTMYAKFLEYLSAKKFANFQQIELALLVRCLLDCDS